MSQQDMTWKVPMDLIDITEDRNRLTAIIAELVVSCDAFRDSVLYQRWSLEDNGMTGEQVNDVLNLFDTLIGDELDSARARCEK